MRITTDYLVIGSGVAGLSFALEASAHADVLLVTKRSADESNTKYAQGGIAAVLSSEDSFEAHVADTRTAGAGLCHDLAVEVCVREGPGRIKALRDIGTRFDLAEGAGKDDADALGVAGRSPRESGQLAQSLAAASGLVRRRRTLTGERFTPFAVFMRAGLESFAAAGPLRE